MENIDRNRLARNLHQLLIAKPKQDKRQLLHSLKSWEWNDLTTSDINSVLYGFRNLFGHDENTPPLWHALNSPSASIGLSHISTQQTNIPIYYSGPTPRAWQFEAWEAWKAAGRRGVVEAVTGTGKTTVGILAAADAASRGFCTLIIVPGLDLLDQWYGKLIKELPGLKIGRFSGGWKDTFDTHHVIVSTVQSASKWLMLPQNLPGLLIADEVHRYGADVYARALEDAFDERLGLTATYEREDYGIERYLTPYFSPRRNFYAVGDEIVADCGYARGLADKILARFRVGLLGVNLTSSEQLEYQEYDEQAKRSRMFLINEHNCPEEPFGEFMRAVTKLSEGNNNETRSTIHARQYLNAFSKRRALLADCQRKLSALELLFPILTLAKRTLVFTETVHSAQRAAETLRQLGMPAFDYTSKLTREKRKERLSDFRSGKIRVLAAPRVLDEGIDVPEADIGVIVAASRSRRQMIQRMGRIIRPKPDDRLATFFVLYVHNTAEDPNYGAHSTFLSEMMDTAEEVTIFPNQVNQIELLMWFMNLK